MIVLAPIAGKSVQFASEEFAYPKPLIEIAGKPMITWAIENLQSIADDTRFVFVAEESEARRYSYESIFRLSTGGRSQTLTLKGATGGALCTCLMAVDAIDPDEPLVIANTDQIIDADLKAIFRQFETMQADAGVVIFESVHPRWSYVIVEEGFVTQASEKHVISKNAIAGLYYFRKASLFFEAAQRAVKNSASTQGVFFISSSLNEIIISGGSVRSVKIHKDDYHSFYDPRNIENFELSQASLGETQDLRLNVLIPAAGEGSRFAKAGYQRPKPFIDVAGQPMIQRVLDNMPTINTHYQILLRRSHAEDAPNDVAQLEARGVKVQTVEALTEGTACTVLLAREHFDNDQPLLIANSDQLVDVSLQAFVDDCFDRGLDGSILVFRDSQRNPKWSFARLDEGGLVVEVAEKQPISDLATVGIYLFRRGRDFAGAAIDMIARNDRVNGEFYTCPVYNYMIRMGMKIGVYEIDQDAMHGLGTPEDLERYLG